MAKTEKAIRNSNAFRAVLFLHRYAKLEGKRLSADKILLVIGLWVEANSVRSTERFTGVHRDTILRLLETVGKRCLMIQKVLVRNVQVANVEADEIWAYVGIKQKTADAQGLIRSILSQLSN